jgi:hypothetical protein
VVAANNAKKLGWGAQLKAIVRSALVLTVMLLPTRALAQFQPWLAPGGRVSSGVRVGDLELHPGVAAEAGFDSNYFQGSGDSEFEPVVPSARLRLTPSLMLRTLGAERGVGVNGGLPPKLVFQTQISGRLNELFMLGSGSAENPRTFIEGDLGASADLLPGRTLGYGLNIAVNRMAQPSSDPSLPGAAISRTAFGGGAEVRFRPGGGTLEWALGYDGRYTVFDEAPLARDLDTVDHGANLRGRWTFLPQTALLYDGRVAFVRYVNDNSRLSNSTPVSSTLGINGLVTSKVGALVQGGWKSTFFEPRNDSSQVLDYDGLVGQVELSWYPYSRQGLAETERGLSSVRIGGQRDVATSGIANYYTINRIYSEVLFTIGSQFNGSFRGALGFVEHPVPRDANGSSLRLDGAEDPLEETRMDAQVNAEYRLTGAIALIGNVSFSASKGDDNILVLRPDPNNVESRGGQDNLEYQRFTALLGARWFL